MTRNDETRSETDDGRAGTESERADDADSEHEESRLEKYFEYVLDLFSLV